METIQEASKGIAPIDGAKALELLRAAVETRGKDYIYESPAESVTCAYQFHYEPSCVVGVALSLHGVPIEVLLGLDGDDTDGVSGSISAIALTSHCEFVTHDAAEIFQSAQSIQDRAINEPQFRDQSTWGDALAAAESRLGELMSR